MAHLRDRDGAAEPPGHLAARITWSTEREPSCLTDGGALAGISTVARRFGVTLRALRFYESKGLLQPLRDGQARYYRARDLVRLELILKGKQLGFTLAEIISMLNETPDGGDVDLMVTPEQLLGQIRHLERQHSSIEQALAELRKRYYLLSEPAAG